MDKGAAASAVLGAQRAGTVPSLPQHFSTCGI